MAKKKIDIIKQNINRDLIDQLERNGTVGEYYKDLIEDYMQLWRVKCLLAEDIRERGVVVDYVSNNGVVNKRKNDSVGEILKVNAQMVKLLDALGISPAQTEGGDDDEM